MDREQALDVALGQIERNFGKGAVMKMSDQAHVSVGASFGLAVCPKDSLEPQELMAIADRGMYEEKRERQATTSRSNALVRAGGAARLSVVRS
jgi:GGDEF domain-containing protein